MKNRILSLILALAMLFTLTACGGGEAKETPETRRANNEIAIGLVQDLGDSLDPHKSASAATRELLYNVYEGLVKPNADGELIPAVAESWVLSDDRCTYTFTLRNGVKFWDGTPVTAEDVIASLERCRDDGYVPALAVATFAADGNTVSVTIDKPNGEFLTYLTSAIVPAAKIGVLDTETWGTGPYHMTSRLVQNSIVFERNENYWGEAGKMSKVTFRIVESAEAIVMALKSGAIDLSNHLTSTQASQLGDFQILEGTMNLVQAVYLNHAVEPLNNELVRKALCHALDREQVFAMVADGHGTALGSSVYPNFRKYFLPELVDLYPHDVEKAKALLKEAGYENGFSLTITVSSEHQPHMDAAQIIAEQFRAIGVEVSIKPVEWGAWVSDVYNGRNFEATVVGFDASTLTARALLERFNSASSKNMINYSNPAYDAAYERALSAATDEEQTAAWIEMETILAETAANVYIQDLADLVAMREGLTGYQFYPLYVMDVASLCWE